jgi:hypothetical protein
LVGLAVEIEAVSGDPITDAAHGTTEVLALLGIFCDRVKSENDIDGSTISVGNLHPGDHGTVVRQIDFHAVSVAQGESLDTITVEFTPSFDFNARGIHRTTTLATDGTADGKAEKDKRKRVSHTRNSIQACSSSVWASR